METAAALPWTAELLLQHPEIDATHEEFVSLLHALQLAPGPEALQALIVHCESHFGMEEAWMAELGVPPEHCHFSQHRMVLDLLREVARRQPGAPELVERLVPALAEWFPGHASMMDAALVEALRQRAAVC